MKFLLDINFLRRTVVVSDEEEKYPNELLPNSMGAVWNDGSDVYFVFRRKDVGGGMLAHECVHIVHSLMQLTGQKADEVNDEFEAYLIEWIYRELFDFVFYPKKVPASKIKRDSKILNKVGKLK